MSREARADSRQNIGRSARVPLGVPRLKLAVPEISGHVCRWFNDLEGRLAMALQGGYEFVSVQEAPQFGDLDIDNVNRDLGARVSRVVDKTTGTKAHLMKIKKEYYEEDQAAKMQLVQQTDHMIKQGKLMEKSGDNRYIPDNGRGIKIDE